MRVSLFSGEAGDVLLLVGWLRESYDDDARRNINDVEAQWLGYAIFA